MGKIQRELVFQEYRYITNLYTKATTLAGYVEAKFCPNIIFQDFNIMILATQNGNSLRNKV